MMRIRSSVILSLIISLLVIVVVIAPSACIPTYTPPACDTGAVCKAVKVGSTPNDVKLATCDKQLVAVVVESGDSRVTTYSMPDGKEIASLDLTESNQGGSDPFQVAVDEAHQQALVTLRNSDTVALLNFCTGALLTAPKITDAHKPQAVIFDAASARYFVAFTNVVDDGSPGTEPTINPGAVAELDVVNGTLKAGPSVQLPCKDPQGLLLDDAGAVWASCTGPLGQDASGTEVAFEAGSIVQIDFTNHTIASTINTGKTAPSTPVSVVVSGTPTLFAGSDVAPALLSAPTTNGATLASALTFDGPAVDSVFGVQQWTSASPILLASQFSADALRVVDVSQSPPQLVDTVQAGPGGSTFRGLLAFDIDRGGGDVDAVALFTLSSEIVPLRLHTRPWATR